MDAGLVREGVGADQWLVPRFVKAGELANDIGEPLHLGAVDADVAAVEILHPDRELLQRDVPGPFANAVDRSGHGRRSCLDAGEGVGQGQSIIVVEVQLHRDLDLLSCS